ncbi:putative c6 zinc finger domain-containing protein [Diaporthe ampelina]|uniref:Putative c6 zinc finger domain-containing protein n=1 Tax=Diaporthe ampelina TaxID=1214573 RepID=A0A0G2IFK1_9PEZI|nr:putative c6 zinc finger domain-containing protein [Diaporthe ampelina]
MHVSLPIILLATSEVQRVDGSTDSWRWVIGELRRCPRDLAARGETLFIHKHLYRDAMPRAIRAALGTSAAFCMLEQDKRQLLYRALDAEVLDLLRDPPLMDTDEGRGQDRIGGASASSSGNIRSGLTLLDELARLQALTLYQMIRVFGGGLEHRLVAEQQRGLVTTWALQLLRRSRAELGGDGRLAPDMDGDMYSWHSWIVAESIRRTVMIVYMFYGMYSLATAGFCVEKPTLAKLPVSAAAASWHSEAAYLARSRSGEALQTLTYEEFTQSWVVSPPARMDPFDKFLVVPCKGLERVTLRS